MHLICIYVGHGHKETLNKLKEPMSFAPSKHSDFALGIIK